MQGLSVYPTTLDIRLLYIAKYFTSGLVTGTDASNGIRVIMNIKDLVFSTANWLFGVIVLAIGVINMGWGNDPEYGVFIFLLGFVFFPPVGALFKAKSGYRIHPVLKVLLALFILWTALGVGELFDKIDLMRKDLA